MSFETTTVAALLEKFDNTSLGADMLRINDQEFAFLVDYVKKRYGINLINKRVLVEGRLSNYLTENGFADYGAYIRALTSDSSGREISNFINKVTTNHTYFMREADHFDYFRTAVLPLLEKNVRDRDLRIWCAACSTGEESYTLAMILQDYFGDRFPKWDKSMLATDISQRVLDQACLGIYEEAAIEKVPDVWKRKYFTPAGPGKVQIHQRIRDEVVHRSFNLMDPIQFKRPYHVIFCRNVMIYFDAPTKERVLQKLYECLCPGGFLFIGHTEAIPKPTRFNYIIPSVYQKGV